jgi:hypothetical protein
MKFFLIMIGLNVCSFAAGTKSWVHGTQADFEKGKLNKLSLRSDGRLSLAPVFSEVFDASTNYLWAVAEDSKGTLYVGGSGQDGKAKVYANGKTLAELPGLEVHAIAVDRQDRVYAATSPDGKVYRLGSSGSNEVFYDPKAKYIWGLAFNAQGELFVATGDKGEVHKVGANGTGSVFYQTEEAHARSMAIDGQGNVWVGTEPGGLIFRVTAAGQGFAVYQSSKREITAIAVDGKGQVYAAAVGTRPAGGGSSPAPVPMPAPPPPATGAAGGRPATPPPPPSLPSFGVTIPGGSDVIRIEADGYPRKLWTNANEIAYSIAFDAQGRALVGTGNKGNLYRLDNDLLWSLLVNAKPTQITGLLAGRGGKVIAVTGNGGKVFQLGPGMEKEGTYESEALDSGFFANWGRMNFNAELKGGSVALESRGGNLETPQKNWSEWAAVPLRATSGRAASPAARFLQYRLSLKSAAAGGQSPELASVDIAYLPKNVAPVVELIDLTPANYKFPAQTPAVASASPQTLTLPAMGRNSKTAASSFSSDGTTNTMNYAKGFAGARWLAKDENGDSLTAKIEIRGVKESAWKVLKEEQKERQISWDSTSYPDGEYVVRVTVSDAPGNPPGQALAATLESDPFVIDNTPPRISGLAGTRNGSRIDVKWKAADALNVIEKAEYSLDGGDWKTVEPTTKLSDSLEHDYVLAVDGVGAGEHTLAVRVSDEYENVAVEKVVVR